MANTIKPTVGRVVHYVPKGPDSDDPEMVLAIEAGRPLLAAIVAKVHTDDCVTLAYVDENRTIHSAAHVLHEEAAPYLEVDEDTGEAHQVTPCREGRDFWRWMPYQVGQAAKTESEIPALLARIEALEAEIMTPEAKAKRRRRTVES